MPKITKTQLRALNELKITKSSSTDKITSSEIKEVIESIIDSFRHEDEKLDITGIQATGTPSDTTFLRGDGVWSTVQGGGAGLTQEQVEDFVDGLIISGAGIVKAYDDQNGILNLSVDPTIISKLNLITVTSSTDLDQIKTDVTTNNTKVTYPGPQDISISGSDLTISDGSTITLPTGAGGIASLSEDTNPTLGNDLVLGGNDIPVSPTQQAALDLKLAISDINDTLTSTSTVQALSANQGKALKDSLDAINTLVSPPTTQDISSNRNLLATDIYNTISCTTSATLTIPLGFSAMAIGESVNLETIGTTLIVTAAASVTLNGNSAGSETIGSDSYSGSVLKKIGTNSYIVLK